MEYIIISLVAFSAAMLTFFSGFGLGTILTPVFVFFFPVEIAIALTAIVHFLNNIYKLILVGKHAKKEILIRFGIPAVIAAIIGSWLMVHVTQMEALFSYNLFGKHINIYPIKLIIAIILISFSLIDLIPYFNKLQFDKSKLPIGGIISGFFGGLSGNQGALRSAFLIKAGLSKEAFVGTAVVVSVFVDITRLGVYSTHIHNNHIGDKIPLIICATSAALIGTFFGNRLLKKITLKSLQIFVAIMLIIIALALGTGLL